MMRKFCLAMVLWLFAWYTVTAQMTFTGGPLQTSGECWALWASGDTALMGFNKGLHRTTDGGLTWHHLTNGIPSDVDPRTIEYSNKKLIVGTNSGARIYQSDDFGNSFVGGTGVITAIAIPTASTSGPNNSMIGGTLFQPYVFDFAKNDWNNTGGSGFITTHGIRYLGGDTVWICRGKTTSYSHDNGTTWTDIVSEPKTDVGGGVILSSAALDFEKVGDRILVYTNLTGFPVLYTDDYGNSWEVGDLTSTSWSDYGRKFIRIADDHLLSVNLSGVWKSTDKGATWKLIQSIPEIRTMALFKGDHLLVGTDNGLCEFDKYGEGALVRKHGTVGTSSNLLLHSDGTILAGTGSGIQQYDPVKQSWSVFQDMNSMSMPLKSQGLSQVGDTLYAFDESGFHASGDGGVTFTAGNTKLFDSRPLSTLAQLGDKKFAATYHSGFGVPQAPAIFYSSDNGQSYTKATFTNTPSMGFGAAGGNFVERFMETPNALVADMNAGYAISTDGGLNWTFKGGVWDHSFLAVSGSTIYHYRATTLPIPERKIEMSTDGGATWTELSQTGLPNSGAANYMGAWGVWNLNGSICTYNSFESPRGIYTWDENTEEWALMQGSHASIENSDGITGMHAFDGVIYANWNLRGTWKVGGPVGFNDLSQEQALVHVFPNPSQNELHLVVKEGHALVQIQVVDIKGNVIFTDPNPGAATISTSGLAPGVYLLRYNTKHETGLVRFMKQ